MPAVQRLRQLKREQFLAHAFVAGKQERAAHATAGQQTPQRVLNVFVAY
jgi:hypothetical protein